MVIMPDIYFAQGSIQTIVRSGMDLSIMVLGMVFILILGEIDVSVASIMLVSSMVLGLSYQAGLGAFLSIVLSILTGALCGLINGLLISLCKIPSVICTIATSILFRGVVRVVLKDNYLDSFPSFLSTIAWEDLGGFVSLSLIVFLLFAIIFGIVLHKSKYGRELYLVGNNKKTAKYFVRYIKNRTFAPEFQQKKPSVKYY